VRFVDTNILLYAVSRDPKEQDELWAYLKQFDVDGKKK